MGKTRIEWTQATWNPVTGCSPISPGCAHCYAARMAKRLAGRAGYPEAPDEFKVTVHPERLEEPLRWKKPRMVFVCSMGDLFHESLAIGHIEPIFEVIKATPQHTYQILTKRPERMAIALSAISFHLNGNAPLQNLWVGVTAENQEQADRRVPVLLQIEAATRFVSVEPCLSEIDLTELHQQGMHHVNALTGKVCIEKPQYCTGYGAYYGNKLDWIICGGETGPGARPMHPQWVRSLRDQCQTADTPFFFKSWGDWCPKSHTELFPTFDNSMRWGILTRDGEFYENTTPWNGRNEVSPDYEATVYRIGKKAAGRLLDGRTWDEFPRDMVGTC